MYVFIFGILAFFLQQNNQYFKFLELCRSTEENPIEVDSIEAYLIGTAVTMWTTTMKLFSEEFTVITFQKIEVQ